MTDALQLRTIKIAKANGQINVPQPPGDQFPEMTEIVSWFQRVIREPANVERVDTTTIGSKEITISQLGDGPIRVTVTNNFADADEVAGLAALAYQFWWQGWLQRQQAQAVERQAHQNANAAIAARLGAGIPLGVGLPVGRAGRRR